MVFANFSEEDKQAFFELLDEYFESRPHLFGGTKSKGAPPPVMPRQPPQEQVVALYDYNGSGEDLSFRTGDRMSVVDKPSSDWWTCKLGAQQGLVPANYIKSA